MFGFKVYCDLRYSEIRVALSKLEKTILNKSIKSSRWTLQLNLHICLFSLLTKAQCYLARDVEQELYLSSY